MPMVEIRENKCIFPSKQSWAANMLNISILQTYMKTLAGFMKADDLVFVKFIYSAYKV